MDWEGIRGGGGGNGKDINTQQFSTNFPSNFQMGYHYIYIYIYSCSVTKSSVKLTRHML